MNGTSLNYLTMQGVHNLSKNRLMSLAGIAVLTSCLLLTGVAWLFTQNMNSLMEDVGEQNQTVVYMDPALEEAEARAAEEKILAIPGVEKATFVSKGEALDTYRGYLEEYGDVLDEFEDDNPLKANYRVGITDLEQTGAIKEQLEKLPGVVKVSAPLDMTYTFIQMQNAVLMVGYFMVFVLGCVSLVVISNTIRLSAYARRREVSIMRYVGATNSFIRWPFFVEGLCVGLISSLLACVLILVGYSAYIGAIQGETGFWYELLAESTLPLAEVTRPLVFWFVVGGMAVSGLGSALSIRRHLKA